MRDIREVLTRTASCGNVNSETIDAGSYAIEQHGSVLFSKINLKNRRALCNFLVHDKWRSLIYKRKKDDQESCQESGLDSGQDTGLESGQESGLESGQDSSRGPYVRLDPSNSFRLNIAEMQRMRLRKLQVKLVQHATQIQFQRTESDGWETDLQEFSMCFPIGLVCCEADYNLKSRHFMTTTT